MIILLVVFATIVSIAGEAALAILFGVVGTYATQFVKKISGANGNKALIANIIISAVLGFLAIYWVGEWNTQDLIQSCLSVFALSTVAYRLLLSKDSVINTGTDINLAE